MFPIRDSKTSGKFPFINLLLIFLNIYIFLKQLFITDSDLFIRTYALIPTNVNLLNTTTLTPFITSMFLHAGFIHILSNMWFLWIFGDNVEAKIGHIKYLAFYVSCGILATFIQFIFISNSQLPMVGASGAIAAVLGAYLKNFPKNSVDTLIPFLGLPIIIAIPAYLMLIYWFFTQAFNGVATIVASTASIGGVAYVAHVAGFASGYILSSYFIWPSLPIWKKR